MREIIEYRIICRAVPVYEPERDRLESWDKAPNVRAMKELDEEVNTAIQSGWQPLGGVSVVATELSICVSQVLVRYRNAQRKGEL